MPAYLRLFPAPEPLNITVWSMAYQGQSTQQRNKIDTIVSTFVFICVVGKRYMFRPFYWVIFRRMYIAFTNYTNKNEC
jgi:hypothetical protein